MKPKYLLILLAFAYCTISSGQLRVANIFYENYSYVDAAKFFKMAYDDGTRSYELLTRLGDCYFNNSNSDEALRWYEEAWETYEDEFTAEYLHKYIQCLRGQERYVEANEKVPFYIERKKNETEQEARAYIIKDLNILNDSALINGRSVAIENLVNINTPYSDFGSFVHNNKLYFASNRNPEGKVYQWNEQPYLDIYQVDVEAKEDSTQYENLNLVTSDSIRTEVHEGTVTITRDGKTMYFTRDNVNDRNRVKYDGKGSSNLKIYRATNVNGQWSNLEELPFNMNKRSTGHPALSPDEKRLYFVSDRGQDAQGNRNSGYSEIAKKCRNVNDDCTTDIFYVDIMDDGSFGPVTLLPGNVNSPEREMFPYITEDNTLYFSSDSPALLNHGLLDLYKTNALNVAEDSTIIENMKRPFNGPYDDFALFINEEGSKGYFSSNRPWDKGDEQSGNDDIYSFGESICLQTVSGVVTDMETGALLENARVRLIDEQKMVLDSVFTKADGYYSFELDCNRKYRVVANRVCYNNEDIEEFTTSNIHEEALEKNLQLKALYEPGEIVINDITFVFNRWEITPEGKRELENIITLMKEDPRLVIDIESHTDCRGSDEYNEWLSGKRAQSTKAYFVGRGFGDRINSAVGKGESELKNKNCSDCRLQDRSLNADQVLCHKENRRSVFSIVDETPVRKCDE
ncbi:MAG: OmpA family protein [Flavobacteriaceae bacterium]|nr:OmpA family protein [Flavobacteriaceae bacterium]